MEQILKQILSELQGLRDGQARIETIVIKQGEEIAGLRADVNKLKQDVREIKAELRYVWEDIKKIDNRLSAHDEELKLLRRLK